MHATAPVIRLVLADDDAAARADVRGLLDAEPGFDVVAEAGDVDEALRQIEAYRPDVLVLDLDEAHRTDVRSIPAVADACAKTAVVVLTTEDDTSFAREVLRSGASGLVIEDGDLGRAVRAAAHGDTYLHPSLGARLAAEPQPESDLQDDLTGREVEVLRLIALGHTNAEIAGQLGLSVRTVESHRAHIQQKLRRSTRAELVRYALDRGLIDT
ncbi:MAG: response regulator transcription factor [Solirubrobacteraceae bacterium]|nr:response regulator transcription factor [Solirubrobacteraceae bacterium]